MPFVKGKGATRDGEDGGGGRTAVAREQLIGQGRGTPENKHIPYARHMSLEILYANNASDLTHPNPIQLAAQELADAFENWREVSAAENYRIQEIRFEVASETEMLCYIIYSE